MSRTCRGLRVLIDGFRFWLLAAKYAGDTSNHATHRQVAFGVGEKDFSGTAAAVVPALQESDVLHGFHRGICFRGRERIESVLYTGLHGLGLCVFSGLNGEGD